MIRPRQHLACPGGWHIEPIGEWCAGLAGQVEEIVKQVVAAIEGAESRLHYRSRHAVTYRTQIAAAAGETLELYVKTYDALRGLPVLKERLRGGRAANVVRITQALQRAGFNTPPLVLKGTHAKSGRTMLTSVHAEGVALPDIIQPAHDDQSRDRKHALLRALGAEVARMHRAGFIHGDLTPYNIFVVQGEPPRFVFLDHDRTRPGFPAGRRYRQLRNLVQLGRFDLAGLSNTDRMRVFKAYAADLDRPRYRTIARRVARMLARRRRKDAG